MSLNDRQKLLVYEIDKNIILLASAGTGKTDTLSKRIVNIINKGKAKASEILKQARRQATSLGGQTLG